MRRQGGETFIPGELVNLTLFSPPVYMFEISFIKPKSKQSDGALGVVVWLLHCRPTLSPGPAMKHLGFLLPTKVI